MTMSRKITVVPLMAALLLISMRLQALAQPACSANPSNVVTLPTNYSITAVVCGLSSPTAMTFYKDKIWVTERVPVVKEIDNMGNVTTKLQASDLPAGTLVSPLTGIVYDSKRDWFWLVHIQTNSAGVNVGAIS